MTDAIVAFIWARLAEDETIIDHTGPSVLGWATFRRDDGKMAYTTPVACHDGEYVTNGFVVHPASVIEVYDAARVLRSVVAKRRIVRRHHPFVHAGQVGCRQCCVIPEWVDYPCADVRDVASEWADHPEYRQEWSVT
jgi:hypothetical protein